MASPNLGGAKETNMPKTLDSIVTLTQASLSPARTRPQRNHPYAGMWVIEDGYIRHERLPNGRYIEARGNREHAYEGRYKVTGTHIEYWDDTGFTADEDLLLPANA